jgi:hypothetical protein
MQQLYEIRKSHGGVFLTAFDDGMLVPWMPLSIEDYIKYSQDKTRGFIPVSQLEDEIFTKCVKDQALIRQMPYLKAGVVSTVVINIWQFSGPTGVHEFNQDLEIARQMMRADGARLLHELVQIISIAFPYKPEEIYAMDYQTFLFRLAQSERKLLQLGLFLQEPISLQEENESKKNKKLGKIKQPSSEHQLDAKKLWEAQQQPQQPPVARVKIDDVQSTGDKWWTKSPVLEAPNKHNIDFQAEAAIQGSFATGHEKADIHIETAKMVKDAQWIYADLLTNLSNRKNK